MLGKLQEFKLKYAAARAKEHPELQQVYADKIAGMKATGVAGNRQAPEWSKATMTRCITGRAVFGSLTFLGPGRLVVSRSGGIFCC